jgi:hypothetical protein
MMGPRLTPAARRAGSATARASRAGALVLIAFILAPLPLRAADGDVHWWDGFASRGMDNTVWTFHLHNGLLHAGGAFTQAGETTANYVARWRGWRWEPLSSGMNGPVYTLERFEGKLIAGGEFTRAGGVTCGRVASWNGSAWSPLGSGMNAGVNALLDFDGPLVAGGNFTIADGVPAARIAYWDGGSWSELAGGMNGSVKALISYNGSLVAGGDFTEAGGAPSSFIAILVNGETWMPLGSGMDRPVTALAVHGGDLIVGGRPADEGDDAAMSIVRWDGSAWHPMGKGVDERVTDIIEYQGQLVAAGWFENADSAAAAHIARWDGSWHPMGSGTDGSIEALAVLGDSLFVGGRFATAGGKASACMARWSGLLTPVRLLSASAAREGAMAVIRWSVAGENDAAGFEVHREIPGGARVRIGRGLEEGYGGYRLVDTAPPLGAADYWIVEIGRDGGETWHGPARLAPARGGAPGFELRSVGANPSGSRVVLAFSIPGAGPFCLTAHDSRGRLVRRLLEGAGAGGTRTVSWAGDDEAGRMLPSGVYFVRLEAAGRTRSERIVIAR